MGFLWWVIHPINAFKYRRGEGCGICGYDPSCKRDWDGHCSVCHWFA